MLREEQDSLLLLEDTKWESKTIREWSGWKQHVYLVPDGTQIVEDCKGQSKQEVPVELITRSSW